VAIIKIVDLLHHPFDVGRGSRSGQRRGRRAMDTGDAGY
jgi:hypothetical protein